MTMGIRVKVTEEQDYNKGRLSYNVQIQQLQDWRTIYLILLSKELMVRLKPVRLRKCVAMGLSAQKFANVKPSYLDVGIRKKLVSPSRNSKARPNLNEKMGISHRKF
jgi:hypothetical protein